MVCSSAASTPAQSICAAGVKETELIARDSERNTHTQREGWWGGGGGGGGVEGWVVGEEG
eukprot:COSAG03_NODE_10139_length_669_cov_5.950877_2_plen_59_part_01